MGTKKKLKKEAVKRGFVKGKSFIPNGIDKVIDIKNENLDFVHFKEDKVIYIQGYEIYNNGEWSEIIPYTKTDSIVESVVNQFKERSKVGIKKYNTTLDRTDLNVLDWINHAQQEAMDFVLYLEKLKKEYENNGNA